MIRLREAFLTKKSGIEDVEVIELGSLEIANTRPLIKSIVNSGVNKSLITQKNNYSL